MKIIKKLWRGEFSLVKTYWLFGVLANIVATIPLKIYELTTLDTQKAFFYLFAIYLLVLMVYNFIFSMGLWRSATTYTQSKFWKYLSKLIAIISFLTVAITTVVTGKNILTSSGFLSSSSGNSVFDYYDCTNHKASSLNECGLTYQGTRQFVVDVNQNKVVQVIKDVEGYQKIVELKNCSIRDSGNWKCIPPVELISSNYGINTFLQQAGLEMDNGVARITHFVTISEKRGEVVGKNVLLMGELRKK